MPHKKFKPAKVRAFFCPLKVVLLFMPTIHINTFTSVQDSADIIRQEFGGDIEVVVIAGSGVYKAISEQSIVNRLPYAKVPALTTTSVQGHGSDVLLVRFGSKNVLVFTGRFHYYEGNAIEQVVAPIRIASLLGIQQTVLTNAAGGLNPAFKAGDVMLINDVVNMTGLTLSDTKRFARQDTKVVRDWYDETESYCLARGVKVLSGSYVALTGPCYETRAEVRYYRKSADAIGMSTIHEYQFATMCGMNVLSCSMITNTLTDTTVQIVTHNEVLETAERARGKMSVVIEAACANAPKLK